MSGVAISEATVAIENSAKYVFKVDYLRGDGRLSWIGSGFYLRPRYGTDFDIEVF